jgi:hypothetical protein
VKGAWQPAPASAEDGQSRIGVDPITVALAATYAVPTTALGLLRRRPTLCLQGPGRKHRRYRSRGCVSVAVTQVTASGVVGGVTEENALAAFAMHKTPPLRELI